MKKFFSTILFVALISCSSDDNTNSVNVNPSVNQLSFGGVSYDFDHIYIKKVNSVDHPCFEVFLTKGTMAYLNNSYFYYDDFKRTVSFVIYTPSQTFTSGTRNFPIFNHISGFNYIFFYDKYVVESGDDLTYDTIFLPDDNTTSQSRVVVKKINDNEYSFDFNVITSAGILTGNYRGTYTTLN